MHDSTSALLAHARQSLRGELEAAERAHFERLAQAIERQNAGQISALNQAIRCLRSESGSRWSAILIDATRQFCDRAALFSLRGLSLHFEIARGIHGAGDVTGIPDIPLADAPAFQSAADSRDTVVAVRARGELSAALARVLGEAPERKFSVFPIVPADRVAALLYADSEHAVESDALELLCGAVGAVIESRRRKSADGLISIESVNAAAGLPDWAALEPEER